MRDPSLRLEQRATSTARHPSITILDPMSEAIHPSVLRQVELTPDEVFRARLEAAVRDVLSWYPAEATHASVTGVHPETGRTVTAFGKREGRADLSVWIRETAPVEPEEHERSRYVRGIERASEGT